MPMASLSRWTMSYSAVVLACLLLAQAMMAAGFGYPSASLADPCMLILVHIAGALLQFVPGWRSGRARSFLLPGNLGLSRRSASSSNFCASAGWRRSRRKTRLPVARPNLFLPQPEERNLAHDPSRAGFHPGA